MTAPNPHGGEVLCAWCHRWRQPDEVVRVQRLATGVVRLVCKRDVSWRCWADGVGGATRDRLLGEVRP